MPFRKKNDNIYLRHDRVERATIGTHVPGGVHPRGRTGSWQSERRQRIDSLRPGDEGRRARLRSNSFALSNRRATRTRNVVIAVIVIAVAALLAVAVGTNVYKSQVNGRMTLDRSSVSSLVAPSGDHDPYYVFVEGDLGYQMPYDSAKMMALVRVDPQSHVVSIVSIPSDTQVGASGQTHDIGSEGSDDALISAVHDLLGVDIAHYVRTDAQGFSSLVDSIGGIDANLVQEVDDPDAGSDDIPAGWQTLSGAQAVEACRADNYSNPLETRRLQQQAVLQAVLGKVFDGQSGWDNLTRFDTLSRYFKTDMSFDDIQDAMHAFGTFDSATVYTGVIPGAQGRDATGTYYTVYDDAIASFMGIVDAGQDPQTARTQGSANPADVTVTVRNGAGTTGGAARVSDQLKGAGYQVPASGNTDSYVYDQTLVIYKDDDQKATAEQIVELLGCGRTVDAGIYYSFDTDILVIIGKDWSPAV